MNQQPTSMRWVLSLVVAASLVAAGCSLSSGESFEEIPPEDILFGIDQTTTTTSTTTTTTTTIPDEEPPVTLETTAPTTVPIQTEPINVYFVIGLDTLQRQTVQFSSPVEPLQVLALLADGPPPEQSVGLRTSIRSGLTANITNDRRGVATIDLRGSVLDRMTPRDQRLAIAQLVLTVIGSVRGVGQVRFTIDGEPAEIGIPPDYTLSEPGEPLAFADFESLLSTSAGQPDSSPLPTFTTPPTTAGPTPALEDPDTPGSLVDDPTSNG